MARDFYEVGIPSFNNGPFYKYPFQRSFFLSELSNSALHLYNFHSKTNHSITFS